MQHGLPATKGSPLLRLRAFEKLMTSSMFSASFNVICFDLLSYKQPMSTGSTSEICMYVYM